MWRALRKRRSSVLMCTLLLDDDNVHVVYVADDSKIFPLSIFSVQRWQYSVQLHGIIIKKRDPQALNRHESPKLCNLPRILYWVDTLFSGRGLRVSDLTS